MDAPASPCSPRTAASSADFSTQRRTIGSVSAISAGGSSFRTFRRAGSQPSPPQQHHAGAVAAGSVSRSGTWDSVEILHTMLRSSFVVDGGCVRFSPIAVLSEQQHDIRDGPMSPPRSSTPTASHIEGKPWSILTTSGAQLASTPKVHMDNVERWVDNASHDLIVYRGMILLGWLQVLKLLGCGTFGQVFLCRDLRFGRGDEEMDMSTDTSTSSSSHGRSSGGESPAAAGTSTGHSYRSTTAVPNIEFLSRTDWGGEDFQYYQCSNEFLPCGDVRRRPYSMRLLALKIVKAIPSYEMQSMFEAEVLVRATDAANAVEAEAAIEGEHRPHGVLSSVDPGLTSHDGSYGVASEDRSLAEPSGACSASPQTSRFDPRRIPRGRTAELLAHGISYGHHCLVMTWYGENLYDHVRRQQMEVTSGGCAPTSWGMAIDRIRVVGRQILEAVAVLHDTVGVCHGDIKPENIMLEVAARFRGDDYVPPEERILVEEERQKRNARHAPSGSGGNQQQNYGMSAISTALAAAATTVHYSDVVCVGPPHSMAARLADLGSAFPIGKAMFPYLQSRYYRAPEVILQCSSYTPAMDMWSVGCVLAELLLGVPLLPGVDNFHQLERIEHMFGPIPQGVLAEGRDTQRYYASDPTQSGSGDVLLVRKSPEEFYSAPCVQPVAPGCSQPSWTAFQQFRPYFQFRRLHELVQNGALSAEERVAATLADGRANIHVLRRVGLLRKQLYDALSAMLRLEPSSRISAADALKLPFFNADSQL